jgi:hypothetical protein
MSWISIPKTEAKIWNEKLKNENASFCQFPYYISTEYNSYLAKSLLIKYVQSGQEIAYAAIIEIGVNPVKIGIIESGPILLMHDVDTSLLIEDLKEFAVNKGYVHLQIRPPANSSFYTVLNEDKAFEKKVYFPYHLKVGFDLNIYNNQRDELLAGFKMQCRRKIVLAQRAPFVFKKADENELADIRNLFNDVTDTKGYDFLSFKIYEAIYREGKKYNLCDWYTVYLDNELVNAVFIVKDGQSFYHYTSALKVKGYHPNISPPAKLHFYIMQDCFYNENKEYYNISFGGNDNLIRFKALFNPVEVKKPSYYTFVIKKKTLKLLSRLSISSVTHLRNIIKFR